jgi:hypothetical protein
MQNLKILANKAILRIITEYLDNNPDIRFNQAALSFLNKYDEEPHATLMRLMKDKVLVEDASIKDIEIGMIVRCPLDRFGIVSEIRTVIWGFSHTVTFIGGNTVFIDTEYEEFKQETLIPFILKIN